MAMMVNDRGFEWLAKEECGRGARWPAVMSFSFSVYSKSRGRGAGVVLGYCSLNTEKEVELWWCGGFSCFPFDDNNKKIKKDKKNVVYFVCLKLMGERSGGKQSLIVPGVAKEKANELWEIHYRIMRAFLGRMKNNVIDINKNKEKAYNILTAHHDVENCNGWSLVVTSKQLDALKDSDFSIFMVNLTKGAMMGPHWNPTTAEIGVVVKGRGMVHVVCPASLNATEGCRNLRFRVEEGDVFVVPRYHPMAQMSFNNGSFVFVGFTTTTKKNHPQYLAGSASVLQVLDKGVVAASFGVSNTTMDEVLKAQREAIILECVSCAEEEERLMEEEIEKEKEEEAKRREEEEREKEAEEAKKREEEEAKRREEEEKAREEEEAREKEEEEAKRREEEKRRQEEEEEARRREEEERREQEEARKREEEEARRQEEEAARRQEEEEEAARRKQEEEEAARRQREEEEARRREEEEEVRRREEEEEAARRQEEEAARRRQQQEKEADRRRQEEEEAAHGGGGGGRHGGGGGGGGGGGEGEAASRQEEEMAKREREAEAAASRRGGGGQSNDSYEE